jgi:hypothetical protein
VLESGPARIGKWVQERVNLVDDYRRAFGGMPPVVKSIVCPTDSDQTKTPTTDDFDDLQVTASPEADRKQPGALRMRRRCAARYRDGERRAHAPSRA